MTRDGSASEQVLADQTVAAHEARVREAAEQPEHVALERHVDRGLDVEVHAIEIVEAVHAEQARDVAAHLVGRLALDERRHPGPGAREGDRHAHHAPRQIPVDDTAAREQDGVRVDAAIQSLAVTDQKARRRAHRVEQRQDVLHRDRLLLVVLGRSSARHAREGSRSNQVRNPSPRPCTSPLPGAAASGIEFR